MLTVAMSGRRSVDVNRPTGFCPWLPNGHVGAPAPVAMAQIEISEDLQRRLDSHLEGDESYEELISDLVSMYESEGRFLQEGYSED